MAYIDSYPDATNIVPSDIIILGQGGTPNVPGTAITKQATLSQILTASGAYLPLIGGEVTGPTIFDSTVAITGALSGVGVTARFASPGPIGSVSASTGAFTAGLFGTGTVSGSPYTFQVAINFDPSTGPAFSRRNMFFTTLGFASNSANTWEGLCSFVTVNGPGHSTGEINSIHSFLEVATNGNVANSEGYESSATNRGVMGNFSGLLAFVNNETTGTAAALAGATIYLNNLNTAPGAITEWDAINIGEMQGGGSLPTNYLALRIADANAGIATRGGIFVGTLTGQVVPGRLQIEGQDRSSGTFPFLVRNPDGNVMGFSNDAVATFFRAGITMQPTALGANLFIQGSSNAAGAYPYLVKNLAGDILASVQNNGVVGYVKSGVQFQPTALGPNVLLQGSDNASGSYPFLAKNLAGDTLASVQNSGIIGYVKAGIQFQPLALGPNFIINGQDNSGASLSVQIRNLAGLQMLLIANDGAARFDGSLLANGGFRANGSVGFNTAPIAKPTVTGSRGGNAALTSLMTALNALGLVTDSTTA